MFKKTLLYFGLFILFNSNSLASSAYAKDIPVQLKTISKISTSNVNLQEGDNINLIVADDVYLDSKLYIKKGTNAVGIVTSLTSNDFTCQEAQIYAEQFKVKNTNGKIVKINGVVYKKGRNHSLVTQYLPYGYSFIRGGEAQILPQKDVFTLYLDLKNKQNEVNDDL